MKTQDILSRTVKSFSPAGNLPGRRNRCSTGLHPLFLLAALAVAGSLSTKAATLTWDGGPWNAGVGGNGTEWGTAANWRPDTAPTSTDSVQFNTANLVSNATGVTILDSNVVTLGNQNTSSVQIGQGIAGTGIPAGSYITSIVNSTTVTISQNATASASNVNVTVANVGGLASSPVINLGANRTIDTMNLGNSNTFTIGSASDISSSYALTLTSVARSNNIALTLASNVVLAPNVTGKSTWRDSSNGTTTVTGAVSSTGSVVLNKGGTTGSVVMNGANTFTGSVLVDAGILSLGGTNVYTGTTTASGGTLTVNFNAGAAATPLTNIIDSSSGLVLGGVRGGGTLAINGKNLANAINSQTFNGTTINAGASGLSIVNGISSGKTLVSLGAITRNLGGTVNFVQPTVNTTISAQNGYTSSTSNDASGILGGYATVASNDWATNNGTNIVAYTGYTADTWASGNNTNVTTDTTVAADSTTNSLRFNTAAARTLTLSGVNTLASGGLLVGTTVGNNLTTITGGTLQGASGKDLVIIQNNTSNSLTIASNIQDNTTATALTKSGGGNLNLTGTLTYTGGTFVNGGTLTLVAGSTNPLVNTGAITVTGGTLALGTGTSQTTTGAITLAGGTITGGTLTNNGSALDARNGTITAVLSGSGGIIKTTSGTLTLNNTTSNNFTGDTTISEGSVVGGIASTSTIAISGNMIVGSAAGGNLASYGVATNAVAWSTGKNLTVYSNGSVNFGNGAQNITSASVVNILGGSVTGSQIYSQTGATYNLTGGSLTGTFYSAGAAYNILASSATSTVGIGTTAGSQTFNVADGAAATDLAYTGSVSGAFSITKTGAGKMVVSGNSSQTNGTTISGGILQLGNGGTTGKLGTSGAFTNNANLTINRSNAVVQGTDFSSAAISGSGSFSQDGTGETTLNAVNTFNGATTVNAGTLVISGTGSINNTSGVTVNSGGIFRYDSSTAFTRTLTLNSGGTLAGSGNLGTVALSIGSGVTLAPGNSPGTLSTGTQTWLDGGNYNWQLLDTATGAGTGYDTIAITGGLDLASLTGGTDFNINLWTLSSIGPDVSGNAANFNPASNYSWTIVSTTTGVTGFNAANFTINPTANNGTAGFSNSFDGTFSVDVDISGNNLMLNYTAVPEPATWGLLAFSLTTVLVLRRRRSLR